MSRHVIATIVPGDKSGDRSGVWQKVTFPCIHCDSPRFHRLFPIESPGLMIMPWAHENAADKYVRYRPTPGDVGHAFLSAVIVRYARCPVGTRAFPDYIDTVM